MSLPGKYRMIIPPSNSRMDLSKTHNFLQKGIFLDGSPNTKKENDTTN